MAERQDVLMHMQREEFEEETKFEQLVEKKKVCSILMLDICRIGVRSFRPSAPI